MCSIEECEYLVREVMSSQPHPGSSDFTSKKLLSSNNMQVRISCRPCDSSGVEGKARGMTMNDPLEIILCTNRMKKSDVKEVLRHEAVHCFDYHHNRCDFSTCEGLAYTEVRAAREAECNRYFPAQIFKNWCVEYHAKKATSNIFPRTGSQCVDTVFKQANTDSCGITDVEPF